MAIACVRSASVVVDTLYAASLESPCRSDEKLDFAARNELTHRPSAGRGVTAAGRGRKLPSSQVVVPGSLEEAIGLLAELGANGEALAGGSWIMRGPMRGEPFKKTYVSLRRIGELLGVHAGTTVRIGALATHADLADLAADAGPLGSIAEAARQSAFPAIRHVATVGGNLRARPFPEADLVPAFLALGAVVEVASGTGRAELDLAAYLASRDERPPDEIIVAVHIPASAGRRSWSERLTIRGGGEYAVATLAIALTLEPDGTVMDPRVAIGSVEPLARRSTAAEDALRGERLSPEAWDAAAMALTDDLSPRDGLDAPGWYRRAVIPSLFRRSMAHLAGSNVGV